MAAAMVTPPPACFLQYNVPPLPSTALRSHTLSTPVTLCTKADEGKRGPRHRRQLCGGKRLSAKPCGPRRTRSRPGSSRFRSMLHTLQNASARRPARAQKARKPPPAPACPVPLRQPTPSTAMRGTRRSAPVGSGRVRRQCHNRGPLARRPRPAGGVPAGPLTAQGDASRPPAAAGHPLDARFIHSAAFLPAQSSTAKRRARPWRW